MGLDLMRLSVILLVVGGLNWGSVGLMGKDLVAGLLGRGAATKAVYVAVGLAAVFVGLRLFGFVEGFSDENMMNRNAVKNMNEGFYGCPEGKAMKDGKCM
jgi:uncharacterized membrane protein YuzA (DUF378 family)